MQSAKSVGKAGGEQFGELAALLVGEARVAAIGLRILQVNLLMRNIQISADNDGLFRVEALQLGAESVLPPHTVVEALQPVLRVRRIAG